MSPPPPAEPTASSATDNTMIYCQPADSNHTNSTRHNKTANTVELGNFEMSGKSPSNTSMVTTDPLGDLESGRLLQANEDGHYLPRLVLRNRPFGQSNNKVHIEHNQGWRIYSLLKHNWFHALLRWPTSRSLTMLMSAWTTGILVFAGLYVWHDNLDKTISCGLGQVGEPIEFGAAFAFSLETCTTVGYGLPNGANSFFEEECQSLQFLIYAQMAWSMVFNAFLLAFLYARFGRSETRSNQVINSRKALISCVDGQVRFQVRLFDADAQHPVVEAHVRMYCVMNQRPVPRPLRLLQPDDDMGGMLFLSFPTVVSHHVDLYSLLHPPTPVGLGMAPSGLVLRQVDGTTAGRDDVICPVCGESYGNLKRWKKHVRYQQIVEAQDDYPVFGTHLSLNMNEIEQQTGLKPTSNLNELKEYFRQHVSEVICVVEGIDPLQSGTFQSLQSYRFEDIVWDENSQFAPCLTVLGGAKQKKTGERMFQVDLDRYHDIVLDTHQIRVQKKQVAEEAQAAILASRTCESSPASRGLSTGGAKAANTIATLPSSTNTSENATSTMLPKNRGHRRVKSSSRRACDALFVPTAEGINASGQPFHRKESTPL